jgi:hypothetical protein
MPIERTKEIAPQQNSTLLALGKAPAILQLFIIQPHTRGSFLAVTLADSVTFVAALNLAIPFRQSWPGHEKRRK